MRVPGQSPGIERYPGFAFVEYHFYNILIYRIDFQRMVKIFNNKYKNVVVF